jgi:putative transposase
MDFVHDQPVTGRRFRVFDIVDDVTRECMRGLARQATGGVNPARCFTCAYAQQHRSVLLAAE